MDVSREFYSSGEIARENGVGQHKVDYITRTRGIKPSAVVGGRKLYSAAAAKRIASELRRIAGGRGVQR